MGNRRPKLPHAKLAALIRNESDAQTRALVDKLQQEDPTYQALFEVIAICRRQTTLDEHTQAQDYPQTFPKLENLLLRLYADDAEPEEAGQMLEGLAASPIFYQRVLAKLEALAPQSTWQYAVELEDDVLKSDAEILELVKQTTPAPERLLQRRPSRVRLLLDDFSEDVRHITTEVTVGATVGKVFTTLLAGIVQGVAYALDFIASKPGYAFGVPLLVILALNINWPTASQPYNSDKNLLYRVTADWRGPSSEHTETDYSFLRFRARVSAALVDYLLRDYPKAVTTFESLRPLADTLSITGMNEAHAAMLRDYYFYTGVSYLSWSRSSRFEPAVEEKARVATQAVYWLARADSLAQARALSQNDRETFFLGLAYGFADRKAEAVTRLQKIPQSSSFHEQSVERINAWSNP